MPPVITTISSPKLKFTAATRIDQWFFLDQQGQPNVYGGGQPEKQQQADHRDNPYRTRIEIEPIGDSCTDAEYPAILTVPVKALQRTIVNIPRVSAHPFLRFHLMDDLYLLCLRWPLCRHARFQ